MNGLSLFANIGVAEAYLEEIGINITVANEYEKDRAKLYSQIYPKTNMICGDITDPEIKQQLISEAKNTNVEVVMATPPCQGMSLAGKMEKGDVRNLLICHAFEVILGVNPKYAFIENVERLYKTIISVEDEEISIEDFMEKTIGPKYVINRYCINVKDYGVPQSRKRAIVLLTRKDVNPVWTLPEKEDHIVTMRDVIGDLPTLDPYVTDVSDEERNQLFPLYEERKLEGLKVSPWHIPPCHPKRHVVIMQHTATGNSAYDNPAYYPVKKDGVRVTGYKSTYSRQEWDSPACTVTMSNASISSQNNVHPGRFLGYDENGDVLYSDARVLTIFELMRVMSLPDNWPVPLDTPHYLLRKTIGEGVPPLFVKKVFENLIKNTDKKNELSQEEKELEMVPNMEEKKEENVISFHEEWLYAKTYHYIQGYAVGRNFQNTLKALPLARELHKGQYRKGMTIVDGISVKLPYFVHVLKVCTTLMNLNLPLSDKNLDILYAAALLHDILEDCMDKLPQRGKELVLEYGMDESVLTTIHLLSKKSGASPEELKEYFENIQKDRTALLIKLADRGHNVETLSAMTLDKIHKYVKETRDYVYPMCSYAKTHYPEITCGITLLKSKIVSLTEATETLMEKFDKKAEKENNIGGKRINDYQL